MGIQYYYTENGRTESIHIPRGMNPDDEEFYVDVLKWINRTERERIRRECTEAWNAVIKNANKLSGF